VSCSSDSSTSVPLSRSTHISAAILSANPGTSRNYKSPTYKHEIEITHDMVNFCNLILIRYLSGQQALLVVDGKKDSTYF
jgi:hypothetical protein